MSEPSPTDSGKYPNADYRRLPPIDSERLSRTYCWRPARLLRFGRIAKALFQKFAGVGAISKTYRSHRNRPAVSVIHSAPLRCQRMAFHGGSTR